MTTLTLNYRKLR